MNTTLTTVARSQTHENNTENHATTTTVATTAVVSTSNAPAATEVTTSPPIPLKAYVSLSHLAISSALKVAMVSTSMSLGVARTVVSGLDKALGFAVKGVTGQNDANPG